MATTSVHRGLWHRRPWLGFGAVAIASALLAGGVGRWQEARAGQRGVGAIGCWIWAEDFDPAAPMAFYVTRDFELTAPPASAEMWITADESYHLWINGAWVGTKRRQAGDPADTYTAAPYLVAGRNRVVIELRSSRGAGGLLASLRAPDQAEPLLVTDQTWTVVRSYVPALFDPVAPALTGERVRVWADRPTGRWRVSAEGQPRPPLLAPGAYGRLLRPHKGMHHRPGHRWLRIRPDRLRLPRRMVGDVSVYDFGQTVTGYPILDLQSARIETALLSLAEDPKGLMDATPELVVAVPGAHHWHGVRPQRFRYLRVLGATLDRAPMVLELAPDLAAALTPPPSSDLGVFGLRPPSAEAMRAERQVMERFDQQGEDHSTGSTGSK